MQILLYIPVVLSTLLLGAHFLREGNPVAVTGSILALGLLFLQRPWVRRAYPVLLLLGAAYYVQVTLDFVAYRKYFGLPYTRLVYIMSGVIGFIGLSSLTFLHRRLGALYNGSRAGDIARFGAFALTATLLAIVQVKVPRPMLLPERFLPGTGWLAVILLSTYAAFIVGKMHDVKQAPLWRKRIWVLFAIGFFGQLAIGLSGLEAFLMSGKLHVPVPAVILAGPLFRGDGFFMLILLSVTLVLVGPAWCSHLCYFGGFDLVAAKAKKRPLPHKNWFHWLRGVILLLTIGLAWGLSLLGVDGWTASVVAIVFGLLSVGLMIGVSRKMGSMFHCAAVCPVGLVAVTAGKVSPFRVRFNTSCDGCGACGLACPMGALESHHIEARKPGINCTLCGDCVSRCNTTSLEYTFGRWRGEGVRLTFLVLIVALHAVFLGVARV